MIPYTIEAVVELRALVRNGTPPAQIIESFGWDAGMLARVCRKHGIELAGDDLAPLPRPVIPLPTDLVAQLPERAAQIFRVLAPLADYEHWLTAKQIGAHVHLTATTRNVRHSVDRLGEWLIKLKAPYRLDIRRARGGGYRLVTEGKAPPCAQPAPAPPPVMRDPLRGLAAAMPGYAGIMLLRLTRRHVGDVASSNDLGVNSSNAGAAAARANKLIQQAGLPWAIESVVRTRDHEHGFRLVKTDGGDGRA